LCSLLNEQPMGFYPPDALVHEAQRRGFVVLGPDVNRSGVECLVEMASEAGQSPSLGVPAIGRDVSRGGAAPESAKRSGDSPAPSSCSRYAVRIGLGYVNGVREEEMEKVVAERERGGTYADLADLASRAGVGQDALERLAWSGACAELGGRLPRRIVLWQSGVAAGGRRLRDGDQLSLPLELSASPPLRELSEWERLIADYETTGMTLATHPMELIRSGLGDGFSTSAELEEIGDGTAVRVAGLVVARQRPATANGIVFMLLEDEAGTINLIVPPPVYARHRMAVRAAPMARVRGRLERRGPNTNVLVSELHQLQRPDLPLAEVRTIEPPPERETGRQREVEDLAIALPPGHSFGRRGR
jgi:error-prone DNA polymerase